MGITINHRLAQRKVDVKATLDQAQNLAMNLAEQQAEKIGVTMEIRREDDFTLLIDIGHCETLAFEFKSIAEIETEDAGGFNYERDTLKDAFGKIDAGYEIKLYPQNELYYASGFCKTQYSDSLIEHKWVADILRVVASRCTKVEVGDEGDYYHSGKLSDAKVAIQEVNMVMKNFIKNLNNGN